MSGQTLSAHDVLALELNQIEAASWSILQEGAASDSSPLRFPVLATRSSNGVDARVLVLRNVDEQNKTLEFHTDKRSAKIRQIEDHPEVSWVFYDPTRKLQLRVAGAARVNDEGLEQAWNGLNEHTKRAYAQVLVPGTKVQEIRQGAPCAHIANPEEGKPNFALVTCDVNKIEWLALSRTGHRCAAVQLSAEGWSSTWVMP